MIRQRLLNLGMAIATLTITSITPRSAIAAEWSKIEERGQIKVAVKDNLRPLGFKDKQGELVGLEIDIARKLAAELLGDRNAVEFLPVTNQERLQIVLNDQVDIAIARITVTTPRARIVDFSPYYYLDGTGIVTKDFKIKAIESLSQSKIALLNNSETIAVVRNKLPDAKLIGVDSYQAAWQLIESGQADAFAGDRTILTGWIQEYPEYNLLPDRLSGAPLAIAMPKGLQYQELRSKINEAIARWQESGWLHERIKYWKL
jgi:polar amino acid transport system substrate-binding protein